MGKKKTVKRDAEKEKLFDDERFAGIHSDPRFDALPTKKRKVIIDERFKSMLSDRKFGVHCELDMRGRKVVNLAAKNSLKDLYDIETKESSSGEGTSSENEKEIKIDLARGDGNISSSDEDSDDEWNLEEDEVQEHGWSELDREARRVEWASRRLALCNMEWDRITATDIYVLLSSFKPPNSGIIAVTIYLSDFGKEKLEDEEKHGPKLPNIDNPIEDADEMDSKTREALRAYQLDRMRYYYAIIECDSEKTASVIYESCDGAEFESSAIRMDLRFVPDEMSFEESMAKDKATGDDISINTFKPKIFESSALSKSSTKLTWDETNPERLKAVREAFDPDADLENFQSLIAPASSDEEDFQENNKVKLLLETVEAAKKKKGDSIEVVWEPGADLVDDAVAKEKPKAVSPWEKYLEKRKAKRKERKMQIAELKKKGKAESNENLEQPFSVSLKKKSQLSSMKHIADAHIDDERFSALYSNSAFAIDQSNPVFKVTGLVNKQAREKQKKRLVEAKEDESKLLIQKMKKKTEGFNRPGKATS